MANELTPTTHFLCVKRDKFCVAKLIRCHRLPIPFSFLFCQLTVSAISNGFFCSVSVFTRLRRCSSSRNFTFSIENIRCDKERKKTLSSTIMWLWQSFDLCKDTSRQCHSAAILIFRVLAPRTSSSKQNNSLIPMNKSTPKCGSKFEAETPLRQLESEDMERDETDTLHHFKSKLFSVVGTWVDGVRSPLAIPTDDLCTTLQLHHARTQWYTQLIRVVNCTPSEITCKHNIVQMAHTRSNERKGNDKINGSKACVTHCPLAFYNKSARNSNSHWISM